jgi:hypothetical protein
MNDFHGRPDDHLVEPLFEGLAGAQRQSDGSGEPSASSLLPLRWLAAATVALAGGALAWTLW